MKKKMLSIKNMLRQIKLIEFLLFFTSRLMADIWQYCTRMSFQLINIAELLFCVLFPHPTHINSTRTESTHIQVNTISEALKLNPWQQKIPATLSLRLCNSNIVKVNAVLKITLRTIFNWEETPNPLLSHTRFDICLATQEKLVANPLTAQTRKKG